MSSREKSKPIGSGIFSLLVGVLFIIGGGYVIWLDYRHIPLQPIYVLAGWLAASGLIAIIWGVQRIIEARKCDESGERSKDAKDKRIGQSTINMIVSMVAATFVIAAIVLEQSRSTPQNSSEVAELRR